MINKFKIFYKSLSGQDKRYIAVMLMGALFLGAGIGTFLTNLL